MAKLAVGTRFFESKEENITGALKRLEKWVKGALTVASAPELVCVAVNVDADKSSAEMFLRDQFPSITVIPVTPWGKFVMPLNAMILVAAGEGADTILFTSAEFAPSVPIVEKLEKALIVKDAFVAGARLQGHDFIENPKGAREIVKDANGRQVPWNTYALWDLHSLANIGFPLVGDSPYEPASAGVEELVAIKIIETISTCGRSAVLVSIPEMSSEWDTSSWDADRITAHQKKMDSKIQRPARQLAEFGYTEGPQVIHLKG